MAVIDYFNYGMGQQGLATQRNYDPEQYNTNGKPLSPTTPANGAPITIDVDNDQRNSQQFKQQALQAQQDTAAAYDTTNKIVGSSGYHYEKIDDSRSSQARSAAMAFATGYLSHMGDQGAAIAAGSLGASQAVDSHLGAVKRQSMIQDLEGKGYNPIDIDKWIQTGDTKDLITNKGSWTSDGKGYLHNTLTGEVKRMEGYSEQEKLTHIDTGDAIKFVNQSGQVVNSVPKGLKPNESASSSYSLDDSGDDGTGSGVAAFKKDANGDLLKLDGYDKNHNPKYVAANSKDIASYNERQSAGEPDAVQTQQNKNLDLLLGAADNQVEGFTGRLDQYGDLDNPVINAQVKDDSRQYLAAAKEIEGYMQNQGVGAAKSMGLSGINTIDEAQRAFKSMPQLDRSSPKAFRASLQRIKDFVSNYNAQKAKEKGATNSASTSSKSTSHMSDDELIQHYGG
ncbi:hypothetical protein QUR06_000266 [Escherichia coli]|nr:hypothetical protein [Escherichia coli]